MTCSLTDLRQPQRLIEGDKAEKVVLSAAGSGVEGSYHTLVHVHTHHDDRQMLYFVK